MKKKLSILSIVILVLIVVVLGLKNCELKREVTKYKEEITAKSEETERLKSIINYLSVQTSGLINGVELGTPVVSPSVGGYTGMGTGSIAPSVQAIPPSQGTSGGYSGREEIMIDQGEMESYPVSSDMDTSISE